MDKHIAKNKFDDICPYSDKDIPKAMSRILKNDSFPLLASFVYPNEPIDKIKRQIAKYKSIREFQLKTMKLVNERIIENSISEFSYSGLERLNKDSSYLYISNHRDIMLDASLLQYILVKNGFDTTEITFGANLMMSPLVIDIGKSNKMFKVERFKEEDFKNFYRSSCHLSDYIRHVIKEKHQSVWIAQRNGRTKDGNDVTNSSIIKMLCMSKKDEKINALNELNIVPMAISYEWETCDVLKTIEVYLSQFGKYKKKQGEDLNSVLTGIMQKKGRVHIEFCEPIAQEELEAAVLLPNNKYNEVVAKLIDKRITRAYRLYPNNYIAYDLIYGNENVDKYDAEQKEEFLSHLKVLEQYNMYDINQLKKIYLGIYSNPVKNKL